MKIDDVVSRRTDLSTFLVHFTRDSADESARSNLISILTKGSLEARTPFGQAVKVLKAKKLSTESQKTVCFTETPLEHASLLLEDIDNRQCDFSTYGIAITKKQGRRKGVNPVWYLDITKGHTWRTKYIDNLIASAIDKDEFGTSDIAKLTPFIEQMGTGRNTATGEKYQKEFWWEREWRHVGNFTLPSTVIAFCPANQISGLRETLDNLPKDAARVNSVFIDPRWSMEKIIGGLAGFPMDDLGPF